MQDAQCLIIGAGPAGLSAAIYTARAGMRTLVLGSDPKIAGDYDIDNYFGFEDTISGRDLMARGRLQAQRFGAEIRQEKVLGVHHGDNGRFHVKTDQGEYDACAVILATGAARNRPKIKGLADYEGKGVSYCVSCDGFFHRGKPVMVAGEGLFAANQALELLAYTPDVRICTLGKPSAIPPEYGERLARAGIEVIEAAVESLEGDPGLTAVRLADGRRIEISGLFIAMGEASSTDFAYTLGVARSGIFLETDRDMKTNIEGVFAAGDCTGGFLQIAVAVGEGALAGRSAIAWLKSSCPGGGKR
ncbi:Thioredoxin reductase [Fundidesulfovibrio magnetotacticus]|uniref:Thioredoxin reductase n=1 Tax=Fundidesulfovibrio magnetotacticus TaxID=2730080 RepID=A0A6V8LWM1_9BACT|nr:NAD(P)/FAD-dependent oxidoreductase [Fundidesulfovibrio magnetotacticus]GFK94479.1 Thioredoxin reductase [Fundidesulfovibrio magnetotacticus]